MNSKNKKWKRMKENINWNMGIFTIIKSCVVTIEN
jgi:hypothetical protein